MVGMSRLYLLEEVDPLAFAQGNVGLLPIRPASHRAADTSGLAEHVGRPNLDALHLEQLLDGPLDLDLVGVGSHLKNDLIADLVNVRALLGDDRRRYHVVLAPHAATRSAMRSSAARVTTRWW